ncbi:MAG: vitamin K epoxide reductase family protein [Candidatus Thermoplasmatota archaeon]|nr:vitamin K epoxide reductase family protein [Candidatus Thermoplasmatota archaeon]
MSEPVTLLLLALAGLGLANALYFVLVSRRLIPPDPRWLPPVCRMDEATCARVVDTPYARVFGVSNASLGVVWHLAVLAAGAMALATGIWPGCTLFLLVSLATVLLAVYLIWALVVKLETLCPLCLLGHGVNATILVLLALHCL